MLLKSMVVGAPPRLDFKEGFLARLLGFRISIVALCIEPCDRSLLQLLSDTANTGEFLQTHAEQ